MASFETSDIEKELKNSVHRFLRGDVKSRQPARQVIRMFQNYGWDTVVFGGALRDLMIYGASARPRDIDLVIYGVSADEMRTALQPYIKRATRFGGLHLRHGGWLFDVWPLSETWAFKVNAVKGEDVDDLPRTTFLNVEAVAYHISGRKSKHIIHSHGFFESIACRLVDINLEENPYPELCIVRSIITCKNLGFDMGNRLSRYLSYNLSRTPLEQLEDIQVSHYGRIIIDKQKLYDMGLVINDQLRYSKSAPVKIPRRQAEQLALWKDPEIGRWPKNSASG